VLYSGLGVGKWIGNEVYNCLRNEIKTVPHLAVFFCCSRGRSWLSQPVQGDEAVIVPSVTAGTSTFD
jgi:hypothetical protein